MTAARQSLQASWQDLPGRLCVDNVYFNASELQLKRYISGRKPQGFVEQTSARWKLGSQQGSTDASRLNSKTRLLKGKVYAIGRHNGSLGLYRQPNIGRWVLYNLLHYPYMYCNDEASANSARRAAISVDPCTKNLHDHKSIMSLSQLQHLLYIPYIA